MIGTHITQVNYDRQEVVKYALHAVQIRFHRYLKLKFIQVLV
jgi:hypothetical protein